MSVRETSLEAFNEIRRSGLLSERRLAVYQCLFEWGPMTGAQVAVRLARPGRVSETVRNRITELVRMGVVKELGVVVCPVTGRNVVNFDVTAKLPAPLPKRVNFDWVRVDANLGGAFVCQRCGDNYLPAMPVALDDYAALMKSFLKRHKKCVGIPPRKVMVEVEIVGGAE